jgi:hypothetical protein
LLETENGPAADHREPTDHDERMLNQRPGCDERNGAFAMLIWCIPTHQ